MFVYFVSYVVSVLPAWVYVYHICALCSQSSEESSSILNVGAES